MGKKLLLFALAALPLTGFAQLNIISNGQTILGTRQTTGGIVNPPVLVSKADVTVGPADPVHPVDIDTVANMAVLECDKTVTLSCMVKAGGKLTVKAKDVKMTSNFTVEKGGVIEINRK